MKKRKKKTSAAIENVREKVELVKTVDSAYCALNDGEPTTKCG